MKLSKVSKVFGAGIIAFSLANLISIVPASAQSDTTTTSPASPTSPADPTGTSTTTGTGSGVANTGYRDNDFDWGWLGLIGLAGLAGLSGKKRSNDVTYRDVNPRETSYRE